MLFWNRVEKIALDVLCNTRMKGSIKLHLTKGRRCIDNGINNLNPIYNTAPAALHHSILLPLSQQTNGKITSSIRAKVPVNCKDFKKKPIVIL